MSYVGDGRPTLLYVFTPSCQWCAKNVNNIKALASRVHASHRVIGLSLDSDDVVDAYAKDHGLAFPIYIRPNARTIAAYGLQSTPHTLLIDRFGVLQESWVGAYGGALGKQIEARFDIALPGLIH
jgi:peroxiredoxin